MKIEIENLGIQRRDFHQLRNELIKTSHKFDERTLPSIPYSDLILCCIGTAGEVACSLRLVREEKQRRRERFLSMEPEEFAECLNFLRVEQLHDDVKFAIAQQSVPKWDNLANRQKVWFKLNCICNHWDAPQQRLGEAILLLKECSNEIDSGLPADVCEHYLNRLKKFHAEFLTMKESFFREKVWDIAETILEFLPDPERSICQKEELRDYGCTSDCYRVIP